MFTGIIEAQAQVKAIEKHERNLRFWMACPFLSEIRVDQSLAHNGVCLTVEALRPDAYAVTVIDETLRRTHIADWKPGQFINLERAMSASGRFDGHMVQGHVDTVGICTNIKNLQGSWEFSFRFKPAEQFIIIEKGSICVNGVSLTVVKCSDENFHVHVIPYTFEYTNFKFFKVGERVNLEFDLIAKYIKRLMPKADET